MIYHEGCRGELTPVKDYHFDGKDYVATVAKDHLCYRAGEVIRNWSGYHFVNITRRTQFHTYVRPSPFSDK